MLDASKAPIPLPAAIPGGRGLSWRRNVTLRKLSHDLDHN